MHEGACELNRLLRERVDECEAQADIRERREDRVWYGGARRAMRPKVPLDAGLRPLWRKPTIPESAKSGG